jgi:hypothetical protein
MELSKKERLFLSNQYRIIEALYPDEAEDWAHAREIIEHGFELEYEWKTEYICDPLDSQACKEVIDIMDMYRQLNDWYGELEEKPKVEERRLEFLGFDGNNEGHQLMYARCLINDGKFEELADAGDKLNSHRPTLDMYRRQLTEWGKCPDKYHLTADDIVRIAEARVHPENR